MVFFVPEKNLEKNQNENKNYVENDRLDLIIIAIAKKMNMSFGELNQLRISDFLEMYNIFTGQKHEKNKKEEILQATQADIDKLLA